MATFWQKFSELNPLLRGLIFVLSGLLILLIILQIIISLYADDYVASTIKDQIRQSTDSTYTINFEDLDLSIFSGSLTINDIQIDADSSVFSDTTDASKSPPKTLFRGSVGELQVNGIDLVSSLMGDELHISSVTLIRPDVAALKNPRDTSSDTKSSFASVDSTIFAAISDRYQALEVDSFTLQEGHGLFTYGVDTLTTLERLDLSLRNIRVDSASVQSGRTFITDNISLDTRNFRTKLADSLNIISFGRLSVSSENQTISVDSLRLIPRYPKLEFARRHGSTIDRIDLLIPEIAFKTVDFSRLTDSSRFYAQYAEINDAHLEDFLHRGLKGGPPPEPKPLPFIAFRDLKYHIKIDTLQINEAYISYSEYLGESPQAGTITFEQINATFHRISNYPADVRGGITTTLEAHSRVMGNGLLEAHFEFPMDTEIGFHKINGQLDSMPVTDFNRMLEDVAFVRADRGNLHHLKFEMTLDEDRSNGTLVMEYDDLKISVLDKETTEQEGLKENVTTFLANNFIVRENNTPETGIQPGPIEFERIESKSIFNYWWKSLLSGIKESVKN